MESLYWGHAGRYPDNGLEPGYGWPGHVAVIGIFNRIGNPFPTSGWINRMKRYQRFFKIASGVFILTIGVMLLTNSMSRIAIWAFQNGYYVDAFANYAVASRHT